MRYSLLQLGIACSIQAALADRGKATQVTPTVCNAEPTNTAAATTTAAAAAPSCYHNADPDGALGLCSDLANNGWCNCGSAGDYSILAGPNVCGYTSLDPTVTVVLSTTNCVSSTTTPVGAPAQAILGSISNTAPKQRRRDNRLSKRGGQVTYADSCDNSPPPGSSYNAGSGFPNMKSVLQKAYSDASALANQAQNVALDNKGFTHYFGGNLPDIQLTHFQNMMRGVANSDNNYAIQFDCANIPDCTPQSVLVTDATLGSATDVKVIQVCSSFWTTASTKFLLYDSSNETPSPPYRNDGTTLQGWCRKAAANGDPNVSARTNQWFATAGHSVLHELTHLDSLAQFAGLSGETDAGGAHGTDDFQTGCELTGARSFLSDYIADDDNPSPDYNAESYAAAATEIYFMNLCSFSEIRPVVAS